MARLETHVFACLSDNYGVLVHDPESGATAAIDLPEAAPVLAALDKTGWRLTDIFITHHHSDHTDGLAEVKRATSARVYGPAAESGKIPGLDRTLGEGDRFDFAGREVRILETPGHTSGHICYWIPSEELLFAGDTLFVMGCGRVFEGTMDEMWSSLSKLAELPAETRLFCGHEYTLSNGRFAMNQEPGNAELEKRMKEVEAMLGRGEPTVPSTIGQERRTNPFLRASDPAMAEAIGMAGAEPAAVFAELRERKNRG